MKEILRSPFARAVGSNMKCQLRQIVQLQSSRKLVKRAVDLQQMLRDSFLKVRESK